MVESNVGILVENICYNVGSVVDISCCPDDELNLRIFSGECSKRLKGIRTVDE